MGRPIEQAELDEFDALARSALTQPIDWVVGSRSRPDPKTFIGSGKAAEVAARVDAEKIEVVLVDHALSPSQERNLEDVCKCRVLDRNGLILDIFSQRARSFEGQLQVELAQLTHLSTRLVRGWTHLERQKGGIGLRGPGETQLETDRRLIGKRIRTLKGRLEKLQRQRETGRHVRKAKPVPMVALVGYTNAGKSTLFNALTGADAYVADQLFATLDPTVRQLVLPDFGQAALADTVGFVRDLPHELVAAFRSTLQEAREADLLLHVVDAADARRGEHIEAVRAVLKTIGADHVPELLVMNKIDRTSDPARSTPVSDGSARQAWVSAATGAGLKELRGAIGQMLFRSLVNHSVHVTLANAAIRSQLFQRDAIKGERVRDDGSWELDVRMSAEDFAQLTKREGVTDLGELREQPARRVA